MIRRVLTVSVSGRMGLLKDPELQCCRKVGIVRISKVLDILLKIFGNSCRYSSWHKPQSCRGYRVDVDDSGQLHCHASTATVHSVISDT